MLINCKIKKQFLAQPLSLPKTYSIRFLLQKYYKDALYKRPYVKQSFVNVANNNDHKIITMTMAKMYGIRRGCFLLISISKCIKCIH